MIFTPVCLQKLTNEAIFWSHPVCARQGLRTNHSLGLGTASPVIPYHRSPLVETCRDNMLPNYNTKRLNSSPSNRPNRHQRGNKYYVVLQGAQALWFMFAVERERKDGKSGGGAGYEITKKMGTKCPNRVAGRVLNHPPPQLLRLSMRLGQSAITLNVLITTMLQYFSQIKREKKELGPPLNRDDKSRSCDVLVPRFISVLPGITSYLLHFVWYLFNTGQVLQSSSRCLRVPLYSFLSSPVLNRIL